MFEISFYAGWGDMDFNAHMRNTAYLDRAADARLRFFDERGFPATEFARLRIGPVIFSDVLDYFKEVGLLESVRVTLAVDELSDDASRFRIRNEFFRADGRLAARVSSSGGWLDLASRKLVVPPEGLRAAMHAMDKTEDFEVIPSKDEE